MAGKQTIKAQGEEELIEAASYYSNTVEELDKVLDLISRNEETDRRNDKTRREAMMSLLKAMEAYSCKDYESVDRLLHVAVQTLQRQEIEDLSDDDPRTKAKILISVFRQKALGHQEALTKLIAIYRGVK